MEPVVSPMIEAVTSAITDVISWIGSFITALTGTNGALAPLLPLFAVGIAISAILLGKPYHALCPQIRGNSLADNPEPSRKEGVETRRGHALSARYSPIYAAMYS